MARPRLLVPILAALVAAGAGGARAQTPEPVCSGTPGDGQRIVCQESQTSSTARIELVIPGYTIGTTAAGNPGTGILVLHSGDLGEPENVAIDVDLSGPVDIDTAGGQAHGIGITHNGDNGSAVLEILDGASVRIDTAGSSADGISLGKSNAGDIVLRIRGSVFIRTLGSSSPGIRGDHLGTGDMSLDIGGAEIDAEGTGAEGIYASHSGTGDIDLLVRDSTSIRTRGNTGDGIYGIFSGSAANGRLRIEVRNSSISTQGSRAEGVYTSHAGTGDIEILLRGAHIRTQSPSATSGSQGVQVRHSGAEGDVTIAVEGGSIVTDGYDSEGIRVWRLSGPGDVDIRVSGGARISTAGSNSDGVYVWSAEGDKIDIRLDDGMIRTTGENSHGIAAYNQGTTADAATTVTVGGTVEATGVDSIGVAVGLINADGSPGFAAPVGDDGYRRQTVIVNGNVAGDSVGILLGGGGRVFIGSKGRIGSRSGPAILAGGTVPGDDTATPPVPEITPRLFVGLNLNGRRVAEAIDGWIVNDGGGTDIAVNGVLLHDGETGATGLTAPNGAWNVTIRKDGLTVADRAEFPWTFTERSGDTIAGRDFSAPDFIEEYAPRAAVYEALPGFLLGLDAPGGGAPGCEGERIVSPGTPVWARLSGGRRSFKPAGASAGASYEADRFAAESGLDFRLGKLAGGAAAGCAGVRYIRGAADVTSAGGGGKLEASGLGLSFGLSMKMEGDLEGLYAKAGASLTRYSVDLSSSALGRLRKNASAFAIAAGAEAGRRFAAGAGTSLTPRVWMTGAAVYASRFTDTVASRVKADAKRVTAGLGLDAETGRAFRGGRLFLRGSLGAERTLSGQETETEVSGTRLASETPAARFLAGLGAAYREAGFSISASARAAAAGGGNADYSGSLAFNMKF